MPVLLAALVFLAACGGTETDGVDVAACRAQYAHEAGYGWASDDGLAFEGTDCAPGTCPSDEDLLETSLAACRSRGGDCLTREAALCVAQGHGLPAGVAEWQARLEPSGGGAPTWTVVSFGSFEKDECSESADVVLMEVDAVSGDLLDSGSFGYIADFICEPPHVDVWLGEVRHLSGYPISYRVSQPSSSYSPPPELAVGGFDEQGGVYLRVVPQDDRQVLGTFDVTDAGGQGDSSIQMVEGDHYALPVSGTITVERAAPGRLRGSFEADLDWDGAGAPFHVAGTFEGPWYVECLVPESSDSWSQDEDLTTPFCARLAHLTD